MQKGTKICPYCGETIMASAKKCRYCGEGLVDNNEVLLDKSKETPLKKDKIGSIEEDSKDFESCIPCSTHIVDFLSIAGFLASVLTEASSIGDAPRWLGKFGRTFETLGPNMVSLGTIIDGICFCALLYILKKTLSDYGKPLNGGIGILIFLYAFSTIGDLIAPEEFVFSLMINLSLLV